MKKGISAQLINNSGKLIYEIKNGEIKSSSQNLYTVIVNEFTGLINGEGKYLLNCEFNSIESIHFNLFLCAKNNELYLFNVVTKTVTKI